MRDPKRVQRILGLLEHAWNRNQDMRLGQLYANLTGHHRDVFYIEDDEVESALETYLNSDAWGAFFNASASANSETKAQSVEAETTSPDTAPKAGRQS